GSVRRQWLIQFQHVDLVQLAILKPVGVGAGGTLPAYVHKLLKPDEYPELLGDLACRLGRGFAETPVPGCRGVPITGVRVLAERSPLKYDLTRTMPQDPAMERQMPVAIHVNGPPRLRQAGRPPLPIEDL